MEVSDAGRESSSDMISNPPPHGVSASFGGGQPVACIYPRHGH